MKVIVAHPGKQHSFRLAVALERKGLLQSYITTVYKKQKSIIYSLVELFLSKDNKKRANSRRTPEIPEDKIQTFCTVLGFLELLLLRLYKKKDIYRELHSYTVHRFGLKVAKYAIRNNADIVICYDSNAISCFSYLKEHAPHVKRIMDVSIASRHYMKNIYEAEIKSSGNADLRIENLYLWKEKKISRLNKELIDSQYFLVASDFVKDSLMDLGINDGQILKVPYGANVESNIQRQAIESGKTIQFLFAGQVIYRKGITYALEAARQLKDKNVKLNVVGPFDPDSWFVKEYKEDANISFVGSVTFDRMKELYEEADVFILPSFAEGMAQVGIEAMACGLPVICTYNSGLSDLVVDGINGFDVPVGDLTQLMQKMTWFVENSDRILDMGNKAKESAKKYSWENYEKNVVDALQSIN